MEKTHPNAVISLQIIVGMLFLALGFIDINKESKASSVAPILNNVTTGIIFLITIVNVIINAFGLRNVDLPAKTSTNWLDWIWTSAKPNLKYNDTNFYVVSGNYSSSSWINVI